MSNRSPCLKKPLVGRKSRNEKGGCCQPPFSHTKNSPVLVLSASVSLSRESQQQVQQAGEEVVQAEVNAHRCHDVIGLPPVDDTAYIKQDKARKQQHRNCRDGK